MSKGAKTPFQHAKDLRGKKPKWSSLSEHDKKGFQPYMVNRGLSMDIQLVQPINEIQHLTVGVLSPKEVYTVYSEIIPKSKKYFPYVKGSGKLAAPEEVVDYISKWYKISKREATQYTQIMGASEIEEILKAFGVEPKKIKSLIKKL